jgi:colanic acid biosynthesis glycosyl transferase WcaI
VSGAPMTLIPNWAGDDEIKPMPASGNPLRAEWGLTKSFVVGYSGNLGRGHDFDLLLDVAGILSADEMVKFLFIGSGAKKGSVAEYARKMRLNNVVFKPFQPRQRLNLSLTVPDLHVVTLKPELSGLIVPSKIYGVLAAGRPVLFLGPDDSEIARVIQYYDCGFICGSATAGEIVQIIQRLRADQDLCATLGQNARRAVDECYSKTYAMERWREALDAVTN